MSTQPQWVTAAGDLGTIPEGVFYQIPFQAIANGQDVFFTVIAGELPAGIQIKRNGVLEGVPKNVVNVQGVPIEVSEDITSKFTVRAFTEKTVNGVTTVDRINDRTFSLTVTGQDAPEFLTPPGRVGSFLDGTKAKIQINFEDQDPGDVVAVRVASGQLPPGLTIDSKTGLISGIIEPLVPVSGFDPLPRDNDFNFSSGSFDFPGEPFDQGTPGFISAGKNFQFTLEISDGKDSNIRSFGIFVFSAANFDASNTTITADNTDITADVSSVRLPVLIQDGRSLGRVRSDNYFAFKFEGIDFEGSAFTYELISGNGLDVPPGLVLDPVTGWLSGYIPDQGPVERTYNFGIRLRNVNTPAIVSVAEFFSIDLIASAEGIVKWITATDLGVIDNGAVSTLSVVAEDSLGRTLQYQLAPGSNSRLPQGLRISPTGNIIGRASFNTFSLDKGTTTFDRDSRSRTVLQETTFDSVFEFSVNAFSPNSEIISIVRRFRLRVNRRFDEPYQDLYIKAMPPETDRELLNQLLQNQDIIPTAALYRSDDPNFGIARSVRYNHAFGLRAAEITEYVSAMTINHYWKNLTLGEIRWAQASDSQGRPLYEVVYSRVIDPMLNQSGQSVQKQILWPVRIAGERTVVYPNSLINMRDQMFDTVGRAGGPLPLWMTSKQPDGRVLGFTPSWVIAYVKPGEGARIAYNIQQLFGDQLNLVDFKADRYELDRTGTFAWDPVEKQWLPAPPESTIFDEDTTVFNGRSVKFVTPSFTVTSTDEFDKYLLYPRDNILG